MKPIIRFSLNTSKNYKFIFSVLCSGWDNYKIIIFILSGITNLMCSDWLRGNTFLKSFCFKIFSFWRKLKVVRVFGQGSV